MTETAKERIYREALEILRGMGINSKNRVMMPYGVAVTAQEFIEEKLEDTENLPSATDKLSVEKLQERCDRYEKALEDIRTNTPIQELLNLPYGCACHEIASEALAAIGGDDDENRL